MNVYPIVFLHSVKYIGGVLVRTKGTGVEKYTAPEEEWIIVKPGDRLGIYNQNVKDRHAGVPMDECNKGQYLEIVGKTPKHDFILI